MTTLAVYWETWSGKDLSAVADSVDIIYLAFADPKSSYKSGQKTFEGTGLNFSESFSQVQSKIAGLVAKGKKIMLSVGGASYPYPAEFKPEASVALMRDLGCQGIDIDWEPAYGVSDAWQFGPIIGSLRGTDSKMYLSAACWSVGAYGPKSGENYYGLNIPGIESNGSQLDWINIMAYDAGPGFDAVGALECYRIYYSGLLLVGVQLGVQGWGTAMTLSADIAKILVGTAKDAHAGVFIWSYNKDTSGSPSVADTIAQVKGASPPAPKASTSAFLLLCPNCQRHLTGQISYT